MTREQNREERLLDEISHLVAAVDRLVEANSSCGGAAPTGGEPTSGAMAEADPAATSAVSA